MEEENARGNKKVGKILIIIGCVIGSLVFVLKAVSLTGLWSMGNEHEKITDISQYESVLGKDGKYKENYIALNDIFPDKLPDSSSVEKFHYEYYNPWDGNYLGHLVYTCSEEDFTKEYERLKGISSTENYQVYGITGFPYELCAIYADEYYGVIYALADVTEKRFIYVELQFCNYFTDINYKKIIDKKYLPEGFDATNGNATRKAFEKSKED